MFIQGKNIIVTGSIPRVARLKDEFFEWIEDPTVFIETLKSGKPRADIFTFVTGIDGNIIQLPYYHEISSIAMLAITTYEEWWNLQINAKTRNMVRKAAKSGIEIREVEFNDDLVCGIKAIYDETPIRQDKPFKHYGKNLQTLKTEHQTYLETSQFLGAFLRGELVGFVKLTHCKNVSHIMQILSMIRHWDKSPTNALIAKTIKICAEKGVTRLHYSDWTTRGLGEFKKHHGFVKMDLLRYFVPLSIKGGLILNLRLHRDISDVLPDGVIPKIVKLRKLVHCVLPILKHEHIRH